MKVKCIYNTGEAYKDDKMPDGFMPTSKFYVEIGEEYYVMGLSLWQKQLSYLIDVQGKPDWYPYQLFEVTDNKLSGIYFRTFSKIESAYVTALWGYYELCFEEGHYDNLLDRDKKALQVYFERKKQLLDEDYLM